MFICPDNVGETNQARDVREPRNKIENQSVVAMCNDVTGD